MLVIAGLLQVLANAAIGNPGLKLFIHETCDMDVALTNRRMDLIRGSLLAICTSKLIN